MATLKKKSEQSQINKLLIYPRGPRKNESKPKKKTVKKKIIKLTLETNEMETKRTVQKNQ